MKNVYFVQVDISACHSSKKAYLPYTAGILAANTFKSSIVKKEYTFKEFIFLREAISDVISRMQTPVVVAFCNYCWNTEYNKSLAIEIKKNFPECVIVFGGHNVPDDFSFLQEYPYIDVLVHGEGEETLKALFETIALNLDLQTVPNISFRNKENDYIRTKTVLPTGLDYPSPYLEGWFNAIIEQHPEIQFNAILETSRGCSHQCAYCDWGLLNSKVRLFPLDRIKSEIKWMSEHEISFVWGADANFGLFNRDLEIADALVQAKETTGYPERMRTNYAKNKSDNVFQIIKKFKACNFDKIGATLSFQSLSPTVLNIIGRTNQSLDFYKDLLTRYNQNKMKTYSELILGLPGETYESFIAGIGKLFEIGQHFVFEVYPCILLPNSVLGKKHIIEKYGIETVDISFIRAHFVDDPLDVREIKTIITQTNTMSRKMWVRSLTFSNVTKAFHAVGLLRVFAIYLYYEQHTPYEVFYDKLMDYFENHPDLFTSKLYMEIQQHAYEQATGAEQHTLVFSPCGDTVWEDHEYMVLNILNQLDLFYSEMLPYLEQFGIQKQVLDDMLLYQKNILRVPKQRERIITLHYDVHGFLNGVYINNYHTLKKKKHTLKMIDSQVLENWEIFSKYVIWYGRMGWTSYKDEVDVIEESTENI